MAENKTQAAGASVGEFPARGVQPPATARPCPRLV